MCLKNATNSIDCGICCIYNPTIFTVDTLRHIHREYKFTNSSYSLRPSSCSVVRAYWLQHVDVLFNVDINPIISIAETISDTVHQHYEFPNFVHQFKVVKLFFFMTLLVATSKCVLKKNATDSVGCKINCLYKPNYIHNRYCQSHSAFPNFLLQCVLIYELAILVE